MWRCAVEEGRTDNGSPCTTQLYVYYCFYCLFFCTHCTVAHTVWPTSTFGNSFVAQYGVFLNSPECLLWLLCPTTGMYTNTPTEEKEEGQASRYPVQISDEILQSPAAKHSTRECSILGQSHRRDTQ